MESTKKTPALRGQALSLEVIVSFSFFLAALLIYIAFWNSLSASYYREAQLVQMQTSALGISEMLVLSPGDPQDWEISALENASAFGTASSRGILSASKLSALESLNSSYETVRENMGAGPADIFVRVQDASTSDILYQFGKAYDPANMTYFAATAERLAILDNELVKVRVQVWKEAG